MGNSSSAKRLGKKGAGRAGALPGAQSDFEDSGEGDVDSARHTPSGTTWRDYKRERGVRVQGGGAGGGGEGMYDADNSGGVVWTGTGSAVPRFNSKVLGGALKKRAAEAAAKAKKDQDEDEE